MKAKQKRRIDYEFIRDVLWFVFGGFFSGLFWLLSGLIWCITIIGIPFGLQFFKIAKLSLAPFGARINISEIV